MQLQSRVTTLKGTKMGQQVRISYLWLTRFGAEMFQPERAEKKMDKGELTLNYDKILVHH